MVLGDTHTTKKTHTLTRLAASCAREVLKLRSIYCDSQTSIEPSARCSPDWAGRFRRPTRKKNSVYFPWQTLELIEIIRPHVDGFGLAARMGQVAHAGSGVAKVRNYELIACSVSMCVCAVSPCICMRVRRNVRICYMIVVVPFAIWEISCKYSN